MSLDTESETRPGRLRPGVHLAVVASRYHGEVTGTMVDSAVETLREAGLEDGGLLRIDVPGAFELPVVARRLAQRDEVDAVLCLGLILRGETDHDRYIAHAVSNGLMRASLETGTPILFGVLTCSNLAQAARRARRASEGGLDKGREVAHAAVSVLEALEQAGVGIGEPGRTR